MTDPQQLRTDDGPRPRTDHLVRSEERLTVGTERVASRRFRLEKFVVRETRTVTVEVAHEEFRLVEIGPDEQGRSDEVNDDVGRWLVLSDETVEITTVVVPRERVRLDVVTVTEDRVVTEQVRHERIVSESVPGSGFPDSDNADDAEDHR